MNSWENEAVTIHLARSLKVSTIYKKDFAAIEARSVSR